MSAIETPPPVISIPDEHWSCILDHARNAMLEFGTSHIRATRADNHMEDQVAGQAGEYAHSVYWFGPHDGYQRYHERRSEIDKNMRSIGDNGSDLLGVSNVDVKCSLVRHPKRPLHKYRLIVQPKEYVPQTIYVLGLLVDRSVHLMGWRYGYQLPLLPLYSWGELYHCFASDLVPLPCVQWVETFS